MRLVTYEQDGEERVGLRVEDGILATGHPSIGSVLADGAHGRERLCALGAEPGERVRGARHKGELLMVIGTRARDVPRESARDEVTIEVAGIGSPTNPIELRARSLV
jgi:hypothetical protein